MAKVIFSTDLQRFTGGTREVEVIATRYQELLVELDQRFPDLTAAILGKYAIAIDGMIIQTPLLERFGKDSEVVFIAKIAGG